MTPPSGSFPVLGVPFKWKGVLLNGIIPRYYLDGPAIVDVPKSRVPAPLAQAIDQKLAPYVADLTIKQPALIANPKELMAQAKAKARLTGPADASKSSISDFVYMANLTRIDKVNDVPTMHKFIVLVQDTGSSIRVKLHEIPSGSSVPGFDSLTSVLVKASSVPYKIVDTVKGGLEAAMKLIGDLIKGLCAAAQSDAVKLAQSVAATDVNISAKLKASGAGAQVTSAVDSATKVAAAAQADPRVAAAQAGLKVLQSMCGSGSTATPQPPPKEEIIPWWKRPSTYVAGIGVLAVGTVGTLAVRKVRRRR